MADTSIVQSTVSRCTGAAFEKQVVDEGTGIIMPNQGALCTIHITTADCLPSAEDIVGYPIDTECEICLDTGDGVLSYVFDQCLESMKAGERCEITLTKEMMIQALGSDTVANKHEWWIANEKCTFMVHLVAFTSPNKEVWEMTANEKLSKASSYKDLGTKCFKQSKTHRAEWFYLLALKYVVASGPEKGILECNEYHALKLALSLNIAACKLKMKQYEHVIVHCSNALDIDASNVKGMFRRGQAFVERQEYGLAKSDFEQILKEEPNNTAVKYQLKLLNKKIQQVDNNYAFGMRKMFGSVN